MKLIMYGNIQKYFIYTKGNANLLSFLTTQLQWVLNNIYLFKFEKCYSR